MNPSSKDDSKSNQETQAFDPLLVHEEEVVHPAADEDEQESAEKCQTGSGDKERADAGSHRRTTVRFPDSPTKRAVRRCQREMPRIEASSSSTMWRTGSFRP